MGGAGLTRSTAPRVRALPAWRAAFAVALVAVAWTSLLPPEDLPSALGLSDKLLHLIGYAVLGALAVVSGLRWPLAIAAVVGFGLALEVAQGALGYRSFEWTDLLADAAGAALGAAAATAVLRQVAQQQAVTDQERKRARRRERDARSKAAPERPMNEAKAAARSGPPRWQQVMERTGTKCWLCGTRVYPDDRQGSGKGARLGATHPVVDFVVEPDQGGSYAWDNVRLAHLACRRGRRARPDVTRFTSPSRTYVS